MNRELYWNYMRQEVLYVLYNFPEEDQEMTLVKYTALEGLSSLLESEEIFLQSMEILGRSRINGRQLVKRRY